MNSLNNCGCQFWIITCDTCNEPPGCEVPATDFVATEDEPSEVFPLGIVVVANIAGDYSILNPFADNIAQGQQFSVTIPHIFFLAGTQDVLSVTSLPRVIRGRYITCGSENPCCHIPNTVVQGSVQASCPSNLYQGLVCPPDAPCDLIPCKEPLCCLNDGCNDGSVSAIPVEDLPVGTIIGVWLCREEVFVKLRVVKGLPFTKQPTCGVIQSDGCDLVVIGSVSSVGELNFRWYKGRIGDVRQPVGGDFDTLPNPEQNQFYWLRVRDDCGYCDTAEFFFPSTLVMDALGLDECSLITANVTGFVGTVTYQWFQGADDSQPVVGATDPTFDPTEFTLPISQYYWVEVCDDCGCIESNRVFLGDISPAIQFVSFEPPFIQPLLVNIWEIIVNGDAPVYQWYAGPEGNVGGSLALVNGVSALSGAQGPILRMSADNLQQTGVAAITPVANPQLFVGGETVPTGLFQPLVAGNYTSIGGPVVSAQDILDGLKFYSTAGQLGAGLSGNIIDYTVSTTGLWVAVSNICNEITHFIDTLLSLPSDAEEMFAEYVFQSDNAVKAIQSEYMFQPSEAVREIGGEYMFTPSEAIREMQGEVAILTVLEAAHPFLETELGLQPTQLTNLLLSGAVGSIALDWDNSVDPLDAGSDTQAAFTGYLIYRDTVSGFTPDRTKLIGVRAGVVANSNFTDTEALSPNTYFYVVTAYNTLFNESPKSNEVSIVIP